MMLETQLVTLVFIAICMTEAEPNFFLIETVDTKKEAKEVGSFEDNASKKRRQGLSGSAHINKEVGSFEDNASKKRRQGLSDVKQKSTQTLSSCLTTKKKTVSPEQRKAMENLDVEAVKKDIKVLLTDSQEFWPADYGNYGPLFIRLAWHNSGSYRSSDGRGGADGGRQRFDPERSWEDNTNLDKARRLLKNIKKKYGMGLSWGDLFILSGNVAIESMGGPILGFCGGRIDDSDGSESDLLGPTPQQVQQYPCKEEKNCSSPLGAEQIQLIYVNAEGPKGIPDRVGSAASIRVIFDRMSMNDSETVALVGGGHSFGKVHGACPNGAGPSPKENPRDPWPGKCGTGKGVDTYTTGFEFPWTTRPTKWDNEYFQNLVNFVYNKSKGPGEKWEWKPVGIRPQAVTVDKKGKQDIGMLTCDVALTQDQEYFKLVQKLAKNQASLNHTFMYAWYKLTTRDMGPRSRCIGKDIPSALPFQFPLPEPLSNLADFNSVKSSIVKLLRQSGNANLGGLLIHLSWQCSATFRATDYLGGCNGARIRFSPQRDWPVNVGLNRTLNELSGIKKKYGDGLSWADLIIIAGYVAIEKSGGLPMQFCPGRTDANDNDKMSAVLDRDISCLTKNVTSLCIFIDLMNLTSHEYSVLHAAGYAVGQVTKLSQTNVGMFGRRQRNQTDGRLSNTFFKIIISETWEATESKQIDNAMMKKLHIFELDLIFKHNEEMQTIAKTYAEDNELFLKDFATAWTKISNSGSFDGPFGNMCDKGRFQ